MRFQLQKYPKKLKVRKDLKSHLRYLNNGLWAIQFFFFKCMKFNYRWKYELGPTKNELTSTAKRSKMSRRSQSKVSAFQFFSYLIGKFIIIDKNTNLKQRKTKPHKKLSISRYKESKTKCNIIKSLLAPTIALNS